MHHSGTKHIEITKTQKSSSPASCKIYNYCITNVHLSVLLAASIIVRFAISCILELLINFSRIPFVLAPVLTFVFTLLKESGEMFV